MLWQAYVQLSFLWLQIYPSKNNTQYVLFPWYLFHCFRYNFHFFSFLFLIWWLFVSIMLYMSWFMWNKIVWHLKKLGNFVLEKASQDTRPSILICCEFQPLTVRSLMLWWLISIVYFSMVSLQRFSLQVQSNRNPPSYYIQIVCSYKTALFFCPQPLAHTPNN